MTNIKVCLPDSFFHEEIQCGYSVSEERKKLWAVELDLLCELDRVCKEHGIHYMLGAGTLLGAVRHKGFIPWDDDIDVYCLRDDYNKLVSVSDSFEHPYFLQNAYSDLKFEKPYAKLRNDLTTVIEVDKILQDINNGIYIDIFPIDGICEDKKKDCRQKLLNRYYIGVLRYYGGYRSVKTAFSKIKKLLGSAVIGVVGKERFSRAMERNLSRYSKPGTRLWGNRTIHFGCPRSRRPLEDYTNLIETEFEGFTFPIPANYDAMLRQQYGDYMTIPKDRPGSLHGGLTVSVDTPYQEYFKQKKETKENKK